MIKEIIYGGPVGEESNSLDTGNLYGVVSPDFSKNLYWSHRSRRDSYWDDMDSHDGFKCVEADWEKTVLRYFKESA